MKLDAMALRLKERMHKLRATLYGRAKADVPMPRHKQLLFERYQTIDIDTEVPAPQHDASLDAREDAIHARERAAALCHQSAALYEEHLEQLATRLKDEEELVHEPDPILRTDRHGASAGSEALPPTRPEPELAQPILGDAAGSHSRPKPKPRKRGKHKRRHYEAIVGYESEHNFFAGFSSNISEGGLFIATINLPKVGTQVEVRFSLPNGFETDAVGEVRWTREWNELTPEVSPGFGISFQKLGAEAQQAIQVFVEEREPIFYDLDDLDLAAPDELAA